MAGNHRDWREVAALIGGRADTVMPDLRGFGESDKHPEDPATAYSLAAQTASVVGLIDELNLRRPVVAGYDVGSRVAQEIARVAPQRLAELVVAPSLPGAGDRVLSPQAQREFWYQAFHQLRLAEQPLFPREWSDRLDQFFTDVNVRTLPGAGHFSPLQAADSFTEAILAAVRRVTPLG